MNYWSYSEYLNGSSERYNTILYILYEEYSQRKRSRQSASEAEERQRHRIGDAEKPLGESTTVQWQRQNNLYSEHQLL